MVETFESLEGQVALVTGASEGLGAEVAERLAERGAVVFAATRSMLDEPPEETEHVVLDVTQEGDVEATVDGIFEEAGRLDVVVNAYEVKELGMSVVGEPVDRLDRTLASNLRGPMLLLKHALPLVLQNEGGRVVNVSSAMASAEMGEKSPAYRVSKAGLDALTAYLDAEFGDDGLLANAIYPREVAGEDEGYGEETAEDVVWAASFEAGGPSGNVYRARENVKR
ncbi:SDR family NAD(P)-dependent oxidoreductase [Halocalculus aciditolerans]|uniref:Short-chain dehydrogenase n=1 Tax=Halocalculus aciditolerans TaxID=1383812 RepID=A0A830FG36_9EURY|nr:SDR family oxidoreductase [Halocalculus aciditolerans]GGL51960.1 short-chain dehydrogenase [Halocalculus aciditolerans]